MLNKDEKLDIKAQTRLSVRDCGGQEAAVEASERIIRHQSFSEYGNAQMIEKYICIDTAIELDRFSGQPRFAKLFAKMNDGIFVPLPKGNSQGRIIVSAGASAKEFGEAMVALGVALQDGEVSSKEAADVLLEINEAIQALAGLAETVKAEVKK